MLSYYKRNKSLRQNLKTVFLRSEENSNNTTQLADDVAKLTLKLEQTEKKIEKLKGQLAIALLFVASFFVGTALAEIVYQLTRK